MTYMDRLFEDITPERYYILRGRFDKFILNLDKNVEPISVYDPLRPSQLDQLRVIREVSRELQKFKEDDILKAKQAAEEASKAEAEKQEADAKEGEENTKETEKKDETENVA